jgi:lipopolysaccharide transport system ATP-binding protein
MPGSNGHAEDSLMYSDSDVAVAVSDLGKCYRLFDRPQDRLKQGFWRRKKYGREFWAVRGVTFTVRKGETIGIVGRNGSGKSTLLQIIAETLTPTTGTARIRGRVAALLELGAGFNPEFTGRENVYINGAILGLSRAEVTRHFEEIVEFAEIGDFIDQPIKTYSSGMVVRLAFAVQVLVPKDVLIVDEVLAVGDEAFQRKCFAKIEEFRKQGGTILFVSHDAQIVVQLCDRAVLLEQGELLLEGKSKGVVQLYQRLVHAPATAQDEMRQRYRELDSGWDEDPDVEPSEGLDKDRSSSMRADSTAGPVQPIEIFDPNLVSKNTVRYEIRGARIQDPHIAKLDGERVNVLVAGRTYSWRYRVVFDKRCTNVRFGMLIKTIPGFELGGRATAAPGNGISAIEPGKTVDVVFEFRANLACGTYFLNAGLVELTTDGESFLDRWVDAAVFNVLPRDEVPGGVVGPVDFSIEPRLFIDKAEILLAETQ